MNGILITCSSKRLAVLEEDPETLADVIEERDDQQIPGLLDIGVTWDAFDVLISDRGKDALLGDAFIGRTGRKLYASGALENVRLLPPERVAEVAAKLASLPKTVVKERYAQLAGKKVHGKLGTDPEEIEGLELLFGRVSALYQEAAKQKYSMIVAIV
ncbi:MAG: hypothetical protein JWO36_1577 [Myxococcales bacterium]|nr:hypothetical protein [Myxococcales bacterium]